MRDESGRDPQAHFLAACIIVLGSAVRIEYGLYLVEIMSLDLVIFA